MGMDLLTLGYTTGPIPSYSKEAVDAFLAALTDKQIEANLDHIDYSGFIESNEEARATLAEGAGEYDLLMNGDHRMGADYSIPGTDLFFTVSGGGSWGDDPYEGWSALGIFINACGQFKELAKAAAFVCHGLPDAATIAARAKEA